MIFMNMSKFKMTTKHGSSLSASNKNFIANESILFLNTYKTKFYLRTKCVDTHTDKTHRVK